MGSKTPQPNWPNKTGNGNKSGGDRTNNPTRPNRTPPPPPKKNS